MNICIACIHVHITYIYMYIYIYDCVVCCSTEASFLPLGSLEQPHQLSKQSLLNHCCLTSMAQAGTLVGFPVSRSHPLAWSTSLAEDLMCFDPKSPVHGDKVQGQAEDHRHGPTDRSAGN